jgi:predicted transcriptional regulator
MGKKKYQEYVGLLAAKRGKPPIGSKPSKKVLRRLYVKEARSIREIADLKGCTKDMVARALKEYEIEARTNAKRSNLRKYSIERLESGVKRMGIRGLAREMGVDESTLRHHLNIRKEDK